LPGESGVVRLALDGLLKASGATLEVLELDAGDGQYVRLAGQLDWQQALAARQTWPGATFPGSDSTRWQSRRRSACVSWTLSCSTTMAPTLVTSSRR